MTKTKETLKNVRKEKFTMISNEVLGTEDLSLEAKGLLAILLSNSADWETNMTNIFKRSKNGRDKHYKVVKELILHGYFARIEIREGGKFNEIIYVFSDNKTDVTNEVVMYEGMAKEKGLQPFTENQYTVKIPTKKPFTEKPYTVEPKTETPYTVDQYNNNKNLNYTNLNNTKSNNINQSIEEELNSISDDEMPMLVKKQLVLNQKRLTDDDISVFEILAFYKSSDNTVTDNDFALIVSNVLKKTKGTIGSFHAVTKKAIQNHYDEYTGKIMPNVYNEVEEVTPRKSLFSYASDEEESDWSVTVNS